MAYLLITAGELDAFTITVQRQGFDVHDFEFQEEVLDPQTAEVEARKGDLGIRCLRTNAVAAYPLGDGSDWVANFAADLGSGRFGHLGRSPVKPLPQTFCLLA